MASGQQGSAVVHMHKLGRTPPPSTNDSRISHQQPASRAQRIVFVREEALQYLLPVVARGTSPQEAVRAHAQRAAPIGGCGAERQALSQQVRGTDEQARSDGLQTLKHSCETSDIG